MSMLSGVMYCSCSFLSDSNSYYDIYKDLEQFD